MARYQYDESIESLPSRGAWIEIAVTAQTDPARGCRSPHGERGLKYADKYVGGIRAVSLPSRGAWIEICNGCFPLLRRRLSLPSRGAWIEIR